MKYKLRGDYTFTTKNNTFLRNELDKDGAVKGKPIIIDDREHNVEGQLHKLELISEKKPEPKEPEPTGDGANGTKQPEPSEPSEPQGTGTTDGDKQSNTEQSALPLPTKSGNKK